MLGPRWRKIIGDMSAASGRFSMIVAAIAISIIAVTTILTSHTILTREISHNYLGTNPASAQLRLNVVDDSLIREIQRRPDIAEAEAGYTAFARIEVKRGEWLPISLHVAPDFAVPRINAFRLESGAWPPPIHSMLLERTSLPLTNVEVGTAVTVKTSSGQIRSVVISGLVHDPGIPPAWQEQALSGYITPATLVWLGESGTLRNLKIVVRNDPGNVQAIERTTSDLANWLNQHGHTVESIRVPPPGEHPHQSQMMGVLLMLLIFSLLALALGAVLAATIIGGLLAQQAREIAIMKAIGARTRQIIMLYMSMVAFLGAVSVAIGLPLGLMMGRSFAKAVGVLLNFNIESNAVPWPIIGGIVLLGIVIPVLAALGPILNAGRKTVRESLGDYGVNHQSVGIGAIDRLLARWRSLNIALSLAIRNTFRRRARLVLTLSLLTIAGAMFIGSLNFKAAWEKNIAEAAADRSYDIELWLQRLTDEKQVIAAVSVVEGVARIEPWPSLAASAKRPDDKDSGLPYVDGSHGGFAIRSAPVGSKFAGLRLLEGRWLQAGDTDAVVLNQVASGLFPGVKPGDSVSLMVKQRPVNLQVVGIAREILTPAVAYTTPETFAGMLGDAALSNGFRIALRDRATVDTMLRQIEQSVDGAGIRVSSLTTEVRLGRSQSGHVYIFIAILVFLSAIMATVGILGLASAMSTSVVERTREFGVMRAIGARSSVILGTVVSEGVFIGLLSWLMAVPLSLPLSLQIGKLVGMISFRLPLPMVLSPLAVVIWLGVVLIGSAIASAYPAYRAARLTVRKALAYV